MVKSNDPAASINDSIQMQAEAKYKIDAVVQSYMGAIEEIINIQRLLECLTEVIQLGKIGTVMNEIVTQSKVEFNYEVEVADTTVEDED